ncbi:MAG: hypothetical protein B9S34_09510 [Opitutia bacterium Tous-C1TDCM]|nr:MAG: hypothetical protein B9S34_09510 [Opitutae bacterium Tous-C1TDCM]
MRVLLLAPFFDRTTPGESWSTYKWVEGICRRYETTVLTQHRRTWNAAASPIEAKECINWTDPEIPGLQGRIAWELKPTYLLYYWRARRWLRQARREGRTFDLIHQINPLALRYPTPARGWGIPYLVGPLAGSLPTPAALKAVTKEGTWYRQLRRLDSLRLRHDPWLRGTYADAAAVIGVAPYVRETLAACHPRRFEIMAETGVEEIGATAKTRAPGPLRLLFVGRLIRTKGIVEAIESVAVAARNCDVTFDIVGQGDLGEVCRRKVSELGMEGRITLHGRISKAEVFGWYERSDAFLFPSYREPSGNVVFEAMGRGLPVITTTIGGPGHVVTDACGFRIEPSAQATFAAGLASAICRLAADPELYAAMSAAALERMKSLALWPGKLEQLGLLYQDCVRKASPER